VKVCLLSQHHEKEAGHKTDETARDF